tara:strand:+ start:2759 stop:3460 length:702 start_codon:yes stop_codon:yes gene_type:complete
MRKTRYYSKKFDGVFFAKCAKDDSDPTVQDGRIERPWKRGKDEGIHVGWESKIIRGFIESMYIQKFDSGDTQLCVGVQTDDGVDVLQMPLLNKWNSMNDDVVTIAMRHDAIQLEFPVEFSIYVGNAKPTGYRPCYLNIRQANKVVWQTYKKKDKSSFRYEGVPDVVKEEGIAGTEYNSKARDKFLKEKLDELIANVDSLNRKAERPSTPAEEAKSIPATASVADSNDEDDFEW